MPTPSTAILRIAGSVFLLIAISLLLPTRAGASVIIQAPLYIGLSNGLVGGWTFDGPTVSGTDPMKVDDLSGNGNQGSASGSNIPKRAAGKIGQALNFDGIDDCVVVPDSSLWDFAGKDATVAVWMRADASGSGADNIVEHFDGGTPGDGWTFQISSANQALFSHRGTERLSVNDNSRNWRDEQWHHLVGVVRDATTAVGELYIDGVLVGTDTFSGLIDHDKDLGIGANQNCASGNFPGLIDDVRIYNRALTETEVKRLYTIGAGSKIGVTRTIIESGLVGHWTFDGPDIYGTTALDKSGSGNNGTLTNGPKPIKGRIGQALEFDGEDAYIDVGNAGSGIQTIAFWMNARDATTRDVIDIDGTDQIQLNASSQIVATDFPAATIYVDGEAGSSVTPNTWHHVLITDTVGVNASAMEIGRVTTSNEFDGVLDDVRLYDRVLSPDELQRIYKGTKPSHMSVTTSAGSLSEGLVGHWSFDGQATGPTWTDDVSGNGNSGTLTNGPKPTGGKIGQALEFDGEDAYVAVGNAGSGIQTISFWLYAHDTTTRDIIGLDGTDQIQLNASSQIVATDFPAATIYIDGGAGSTVTPNTWHHVLITDTTGVNASAMEIGRVTTSNEFDGILDDVRLYNRVLTPHEIQRLSAMGGR